MDTGLWLLRASLVQPKLGLGLGLGLSFRVMFRIGKLKTSSAAYLSLYHPYIHGHGEQLAMKAALVYWLRGGCENKRLD